MDLRCDPPDLRAVLWDLVAQLPAGRVATYGGLADALGDRVAARWVGQVLIRDQEAAELPTHRVVRAGGELGAFVGGGVQDKRELLEREGVAIDATKRDEQTVNLEEFGFDDFHSDRPLAALREQQCELRDQLRLTTPAETPALVAGLDVSYGNGRAVAACAVIDVGANAGASMSEPVWSCIARRPISFPYISSYLAFRELPVLLQLLEDVARTGPPIGLFMVDGSGLLHPRRMGIASMLGVLLNRPTMGVTKKRLIGKAGPAELIRYLPGSDETRAAATIEVAPVLQEAEQLGWAIWPPSGTRKALYVSPGNLVDLQTCRDVTLRTLGPRRLPTPIYWADRFSRDATK